MTLSHAVEWRNELRRRGQKLVVTNGCFDILHRGHAEYLRKARELGDALLVLVNSDSSVRRLKGPSRPINNENDRAYLIGELKSVDAVVIFDSDRCDKELSALSPDIYAKAGDYTIEKLDHLERSALERQDVQIVFMPFVAGLSTTNIVNKIRENDK